MVRTIRSPGGKMGRFSVEIDVANNDDMALVRRGKLAADKARRTRIHAVVDPGATRLVLPASVVRRLGLSCTGPVSVRYADGRRASRQLASGVWLETRGREGLFDAIVEPRRQTALLGAIVLEVLDLLVDCTDQKLIPRDKRGIFCEIE